MLAGGRVALDVGGQGLSVWILLLGRGSFLNMGTPCTKMTWTPFASRATGCNCDIPAPLALLLGADHGGTRGLGLESYSFANIWVN